MKANFSWVTTGQAAKIVGCSGRHLQNLITRGRLSATMEDGKYYIEKSELYRVFPEAHLEEKMKNTEEIIAEKTRLEYQNESLKDAAREKDKQIEFLRNQIENMSQKELKMIDAIVGQARLLEHQKSPRKDKSSSSWADIFKRKKKEDAEKED